MFIVFLHDALSLSDLAMRFVSELTPYTFINMLASNHTINLVNIGTGICYSTLDSEQ